MTVTVDTFLVSFPEFASTPALYIQAKLNEALLSIDTCIYGAKSDTAQSYLAAHLITLSPKGQNARMIVAGKQGTMPTTTYFGFYKQLQRQVGSGFRVAGGVDFCGPYSPWRY